MIGAPDREAESEAMAWDCAEPNVQRKFDWIDIIVADELHPLELLRPASTLTTPGVFGPVQTTGAPGMGLRCLSADIPAGVEASGLSHSSTEWKPDGRPIPRYS